MNTEELKNELFYKPKHAAVVSGEEAVSRANIFAEGYKEFLNNAKTEREATAVIKAQAQRRGFVEFDPYKQYKQGEKVFFVNRDKSIIHIYISECDNAAESLEFLKERLTAENIPYTVGSVGIEDTDWNENWKKYFHAIEIGEKLAVVPSWEKYENAQNRTVLNIDPGAAFGTGTHATTSLCLELLQDYVEESTKVLDIGCGSGILALSSILLGADSAVGVDIDAQSVKTAKENAVINNISEKTEFFVGDLTDKVSGKYNVVCANIVADVIIRLLPDAALFMAEDAVLIISGIIDIRKDDVLEAVEQNGFKVSKERYKDNWCAFVIEK